MKQTAILVGTVMVAMLAMTPAASADAMTWSGIVAYPNGTWVPHNTVLSMENLNQSYVTEPWWDITGDWGGYNGWVDGEKGSESDYMKINASTVDGQWYGEITPRLSDIWNAGPIGNVYWMNITVYPTSVPDTNWTQFQYDIANAGNSPADAPDDNTTKWITDDIGAVVGSQTMIKDGKIFVYADTKVYALDKDSHLPVWTATIPGDTQAFGSWASPAYSNDFIFVSGGYNLSKISATDGTTGNLEIAFPNGGYSCNGGPTVANGKVFAGSGTDKYYAFHESDLTEIWNYTVPEGDAVSTPAVADGKVVVGARTPWGGSTSNLSCIDEATGVLAWATPTQLSGAIGGSASIDAANDRIYVSTYVDWVADTGLLYAVNFTTGAIVWSQPIRYSDSTPAIAGEYIYVSGGVNAPGTTYCFNQAGVSQWTVPHGSWTVAPTIADDKLFTGDIAPWGGDGIYVFNATTGASLWSYPHGGSSVSVANSDPMAVTVGNDGKVYAFGTPAAAPVTIEMDDHTMSPSGTLVAPIWLNGIEDYGAATITVEYNNSVVIVADVDDGPFSEVVASNIDNTLGKVRISAENIHGVDGNIEFARITFDAVGTYDDDTTLGLSVQKLVDINYTTIANSVDNGSITLKETDPPVISNETADPAKIIQTNLTGRARPESRANSTLSVDVVDLGSGVDTVAIDLSPIGGSAVAYMTGTYPPEFTGASYAVDGVGLNQLHNLVVTATDNNNNIATSTISLEVLIRGDVVRGTGTTVKANVNIGDALYIARHTVGLEPEADNWLLVGDVVGEAGDPMGDDRVDMADALYIVRYALDKEDEP